jgi:hypothetical protein
MSIASTHRTRIVADAVVSAYINEIAVPAQRAIERTSSRPRDRGDCAETRTRTRVAPTLRVRRWAPRRRPALEAGI